MGLWAILVHTGYNWDNSSIHRIQLDLNNLERWSNRWQLHFNATKCKVIHFGDRNPNHAYTLNGHLPEISDNEKDLDVIIDDRLKCHIHTHTHTYSHSYKKSQSNIRHHQKVFPYEGCKNYRYAIQIHGTTTPRIR